MIDSHSLAEYSSQVLNASDNAELSQRLGLYRVFLKMYEHHRSLLDEILDLENTEHHSRTRARLPYMQGIVQGNQSYLITNILSEKTQSFQQSQGVWVIGRDRKATLSVSDRQLSRSHAAIQYVEYQGFYLIDLDSTNGSFLNGEPVRHCALLRDGDQIRLGRLSFTFFVCSFSQLQEPIAPALLTQINSLRDRFAPTVCGTTMKDTDTPSTLPDQEFPSDYGFKDTSMFVLPEIPAGNGLVESLSNELNMAQQSEILDRFLNR